MQNYNLHTFHLWRSFDGANVYIQKNLRSQVQILNKALCILLLEQCPCKKYEYLLSPVMGQWNRRMGSFALVKQIDIWKENTPNSKPDSLGSATPPHENLLAMKPYSTITDGGVAVRT